MPFARGDRTCSANVDIAPLASVRRLRCDLSQARTPPRQVMSLWHVPNRAENSVEQGENRDEAARASGRAGVTARSRPSAEYVATAVAALCLVLFGVVHATTDVMVLSLFSLAPLVAATVADERRTAIFGGTAVALAIGAGWWDGATGS